MALSLFLKYLSATYATKQNYANPIENLN